MGHFCVDIQKSIHHKDYYVNELSIKYKTRNDDNIEWYGLVQMLPTIKWVEIPKDSSFMAYSLISLTSACIFETIYFNNILNESKKLDDCFGLKNQCLGKGDWNSYHNILSEMRKLHEYIRGKKDVNQFMEIDYVEIIKEKIDKMVEFQQALVEIINPLAEKIEKDFLSKDSPSPYCYKISGEALNSLREEVFKVSNEYGFSTVVSELRIILIDNYNSFIKKYAQIEPDKI